MNKNRTWCGKCDATMDILKIIETRQMPNPHEAVMVRGRLSCGHPSNYVTTPEQLGEFRLELRRQRALA